MVRPAGQRQGEGYNYGMVKLYVVARVVARLDAHAASVHMASTFARLDGHLAAPPDVRRYAKLG